MDPEDETKGGAEEVANPKEVAPSSAINPDQNLVTSGAKEGASHTGTDQKNAKHIAAATSAESNIIRPEIQQKEYDAQNLGNTGLDASLLSRNVPKQPGIEPDPDNKDSGKAPASRTSSPVSNNRTSLDVLQRATRSFYGGVLSAAINTPLPVSSASSQSSVHSGHPASNALPFGQSRDRLELRPEDIPLPPRKPKTKKKNAFLTWAEGRPAASSSKKKETTKQKQANVPPVDAELRNYRKNINRLAEHFPNFQNVAAAGADTRHEWKSRIIVHDRILTDDPQPSSRQEPFAGRSTAPTFSEFRKKLRDITDDCIQRVLLIEDLSPKLIDFLGATFDIAPHVFEEHLDRSGYRKVGTEDEAGTSTWNARSNTLGYSSVASVKWYRPVLPLIPMSSRFRTRLIRDRRPQVYCPFDGCQRHTLPLAASENIWRNFLELCPEPGVYHKGSRTEYPVGWEERVTVWKRDIDGCEFGKVALISSE